MSLNGVTETHPRLRSPCCSCVSRSFCLSSPAWSERVQRTPYIDSLICRTRHLEMRVNRENRNNNLLQMAPQLVANWLQQTAQVQKNVMVCTEEVAKRCTSLQHSLLLHDFNVGGEKRRAQSGLHLAHPSLQVAPHLVHLLHVVMEGTTWHCRRVPT